MITIIKERNKDIEIWRMEAMHQRTPIGHPEKGKIYSDLKMKQSEVRGEKEVDYPLGFLDEKRFLKLHNLRLEDENGCFQIDSLLMTEGFHLAIEIKNWLGTIIFGENDQVIRRSIDGKEEGFQNPVTQVKTQTYRLQNWLQNNQFPSMPIVYLVVISFPSTIITTSSTNIRIPYEVIYNNELLFRIQEVEGKYKKKYVPMNQLYKMANFLKANHKPLQTNLLKKYHVQASDLIRGVFCPECGAVPMIRGKKKWHCKKCGVYSENAHDDGLNDYFLIVGDRITNQEAQNFLRIESRHVMKRLMVNGNYPLIGNKRGSAYQLKLFM